PLTAGETVTVEIQGSPYWTVEAAEDIWAGTLVTTAADGRLQIFKDGVQYIGYSTHSAKAGELVTFVRKPGLRLGAFASGGLQVAAAEVEAESAKTTKKSKAEKKERGGEGMSNPADRMSPMSGKVYGPDGKVYWLTDLLQGAGGGAAMQFLYGDGDPTAGLGRDGDVYLSTSSGDLLKREDGDWALLMNLVGPQGPQG